MPQKVLIRRGVQSASDLRLSKSIFVSMPSTQRKTFPPIVPESGRIVWDAAQIEERYSKGVEQLATTLSPQRVVSKLLQGLQAPCRLRLVPARKSIDVSTHLKRERDNDTDAQALEVESFNRLHCYSSTEKLKTKICDFDGGNQQHVRQRQRRVLTQKYRRCFGIGVVQNTITACSCNYSCAFNFAFFCFGSHLSGEETKSW